MAKAKLTLAIDYDATWTAAPILWRAVAHMFIGAGHTVIMVTQRLEAQGRKLQEDVGLARVHIPVVFAGGMTKAEGARKAGYEVNIWIDDWPPSVMDQALTYIGDGDEEGDTDPDECEHPNETLMIRDGSIYCFRCRKMWHTEHATEGEVAELLEKIRSGEV